VTGDATSFVAAAAAQQQDGVTLASVSGMVRFYLNVFNKYRGFPRRTYTFAFCHLVVPMPFRKPSSEVLSRARTPEDKERVKAAFIAAGRRLVSHEGLAAVSLRRVATEAGYAPGAIYQYFRDQQDLFFHIRGEDMQAATQKFRRVVARTPDPVERVKKLFIGTADYWLSHIEDFLVIFPAPAARSASDGFAKSQAVHDILALYYETVDALFETIARPTLSSRTAADLLLAAVHGTVLFPHMTPGMPWTKTRPMVRELVTTMVDQWVAQGVKKKQPPATKREPAVPGPARARTPGKLQV
jgi:AcrR family transcriptional regulator